MATTDATPIPRKNVAYRLYTEVRKNDGTLISSVTGADTEISEDGGTFTDATYEFTEIGTSGCGYIEFSSTEMNADSVVVKLTATNTSAIPTVVCVPAGDGDILLTADNTAIVTAMLAATAETQGSITVQQVLQICVAALAGRTADSGNTFKTPNNGRTTIAATTNASNERTAITLTFS